VKDTGTYTAVRGIGMDMYGIQKAQD